MNKKEVDNYFSSNYGKIVADIESNRLKSYTVNDENVICYVYDICVRKASEIENIEAFIKITASNLYRWKNSKYNRENKIHCQDECFSYTYIESDVSKDNELHQNLDYALKKYYIEATPSEKVFYDIFVVQGKRTHREVQMYLNVSDRGARKLINEFKQKIKIYCNER